MLDKEKSISCEEIQQVLESLLQDRPRPVFELVEPEQTGMFLVLITLKLSKQPLSPGDLAKTLNVSTARVARLLKNMENKEYIQRKTRIEDGRKVQVFLLEKGEEAFEKHRQRFFRNMETLLERVGLENFQTFQMVSKEICRILEEEKSQKLRETMSLLINS